MTPDSTPPGDSERAGAPSDPEGPQSAAHAPTAEASGSGALSYRSVDLLAGRREVFIEHDGMLYRLRVTHAGKLILTK